MPSLVATTNKLPDLLLDIVSKEISTDININIAQQFNIPDTNSRVYIDIIRKVVLKTITPDKLVATIEQDIGFDDVSAKKLALELLGRRFLPMQWYIGNVENLITSLGGDLNKYQAEARKNYPEVYAPETAKPEPTVTEKITAPSAAPGEDLGILHDIEQRLTTFRGRAEVLLRLTALSRDIDQAIKDKRLSEAHGEELIHSLDALSYAVNTKDLNPLEVAAIKRRLSRIVSELAKLG